MFLLYLDDGQPLDNLFVCRIVVLILLLLTHALRYKIYELVETHGILWSCSSSSHEALEKAKALAWVDSLLLLLLGLSSHR